MENFWDDGEDNGTYLTVKLMSGKSLKEKGWPWVQQCIRGILGGHDTVAKASFLTDGRQNQRYLANGKASEGTVVWR